MSSLFLLGADIGTFLMLYIGGSMLLVVIGMLWHIIMSIAVVLSNFDDRMNKTHNPKVITADWRDHYYNCSPYPLWYKLIRQLLFLPVVNIVYLLKCIANKEF